MAFPIELHECNRPSSSGKLAKSGGSLVKASLRGASLSSDLNSWSLNREIIHSAGSNSSPPREICPLSDALIALIWRYRWLNGGMTDWSFSFRYQSSYSFIACFPQFFAPSFVFSHLWIWANLDLHILPVSQGTRALYSLSVCIKTRQVRLRALTSNQLCHSGDISIPKRHSEFASVPTTLYWTAL